MSALLPLLLGCWVSGSAVGVGPGSSPLIGILTQDFDANHTYMAASYAKLVESAGGRAVAIHHEAPLAHIRKLHASLNGVILPGGNSGPAYTTALTLLVNLTLDAAAASHGRGQVPLWGICLGFEMLSQVVARNVSVRTVPWGGLLLPLPLVVSPASRMFGGASDQLRREMAGASVTMHNHGAGVAPHEFTAGGNVRLHAAFDVTSTAVGRTGRRFANVIEGRDGLQIYGTIWHPEMPGFEHEMPMIPHSHAAVQTSQLAANFFVDQCRSSNNRSFGPSDGNASEVAAAEAKVVVAGDAGELMDCRGDGSQITECYYWKRIGQMVVG
jgi:gamma-glutamyl hydrolase